MELNRQFILDEIKRTALKNNGIPLGRNRFSNETGIKDSKWHGKFWTCWGDATKEAGFIPNKMKKAYNEEWLILQIVLLVKELGHFPSKGEFMLKNNLDKNFPNIETFRNHFGYKADILRKVSEYCSNSSKYSDVFEICKNTFISPTKSIKKSTHNRPNDEFVYLMKSGRFYKIGKSNSSGRRLYEISLQLPQKTNIIHEIRTDDARGIEAYWHNRFKSKRKNGEWFALSPSDVKLFKQRKTM